MPQLLNLPQQYLPGSLPPQHLRCPCASEPQQYWYDGFCWADYQGQPVYFEFDRDHRRIVSAIIPAQDYNLGQLLVSWGTPAGVNWNHYTVYVYWPTRWVILSNKTFRPTSPVKSILYTPEQPPSSPWRGFRRGTS